MQTPRRNHSSILPSWVWNTQALIQPCARRGRLRGARSAVLDVSSLAARALGDMPSIHRGGAWPKFAAALQNGGWRSSGSKPSGDWPCNTGGKWDRIFECGLLRPARQMPSKALYDHHSRRATIVSRCSSLMQWLDASCHDDRAQHKSAASHALTPPAPRILVVPHMQPPATQNTVPNPSPHMLTACALAPCAQLDAMVIIDRRQGIARADGRLHQ